MNPRRQMPLFRFVVFAAAGGFPAAAMGQPVSPAATVVAGSDDRDAGVAALVDAGDPDAAGGLHYELDELRRRVRALERALAAAGIRVDEVTRPTPPPSAAERLDPADILEPAGGAAAGGAAAAGDAQHWGTVETVERVEPPRPENYDQQVEGLRAEIDALRAEVAAVRGDAVVRDRVAVTGNEDVAVREQRVRAAVREANSERRAKAAEIRGVEEQLRAKELRLREVQESVAPFKLFRVRRGELVVTLQVPDAVESTAGYAPSWAAVAWAGELITETPDEQQWRVTRLMEVDERTLERLRADASR